MELPNLVNGIHAQIKNCLQVYTGKPLRLAHEEFLLSLEFFSLALVFYWLAVLVGCIEKQEDMLKQSPIHSTNMEPPSFAIGRRVQESKYKREERLRKRRKPIGQTSSVRYAKPSWFLLPHHLANGFEFWVAMLKGDTFLTKRKSLLDDIEKAKKPTSSIQETFRDEYLVKAQHVMSFLYQNQRLRWIFKKFFTKLRLQKFTSLNDVDPITLERITEPIQFPSFAQRKVYRFEANPFMKHLHNKLTHNDGHIPEPLFPKNPFTNEPFSLSQIISLIDQARKYSHTSWAIESFISCRYNLTSFSTIHSKPLRLNALRTTMANVSSWDSIDTLYDFIKIQHAFHNALFHMNVYRWAVNHATRETRIESWRKLCLKWYEVDILTDDADTKRDLFGVIEAKTFLMCSKPDELTSLRQAKYRVTTDGSSSSRHTENTG